MCKIIYCTTERIIILLHNSKEYAQTALQYTRAIFIQLCLFVCEFTLCSLYKTLSRKGCAGGIRKEEKWSLYLPPTLKVYRIHHTGWNK